MGGGQSNITQLPNLVYFVLFSNARMCSNINYLDQITLCVYRPPDGVVSLIKYIPSARYCPQKQLKLFLYKEKRRGSKWQAIITTDRTLGAIQAYKIYQNRWAIEVSYKELKQYFGYGKCQAQDFDAQIADATQSVMAYNYISQIKAVQEHQSIGQLFAEISNQYLSPTIMEKFWKYLYQCIMQLAELVEKSANELLEKIFQENDFFKKPGNLNIYLTAET